MPNYPYPVLDAMESGYKKRYSFSIDEKEHRFDHGQLILSIELKLNSDYLTDIVVQNKANLIFKIASDSYSETVSFNSIQNTYSIKCSTQKLMNIDTIRITANIVSISSFDMSWNNEFEDYFGENYSFKIIPNIRLAVSNEIRLNYSLKNTEFIKIFTKDDADGNGISFNCEDNNYIRIFAGPSFNKSYTAIISDENAKNLTNNILVCNAIVYTFMQLIKEGTEKYSGHIWYKLLEQSEEFDERTLDEFIENMRSGVTDIDNDEIFAVSQRIMNNLIEQVVIDIAERKTNAD